MEEFDAGAPTVERGAGVPAAGAEGVLVPTGPIARTGPGRVRDQRVRDQRGMVSAEWAVGIIAAIAIAGVLLGIVTSGPVHDMLLQVILKIINTFSNGLSKLPN